MAAQKDTMRKKMLVQFNTFLRCMHQRDTQEAKQQNIGTQGKVEKDKAKGTTKGNDKGKAKANNKGKAKASPKSKAKAKANPRV